MQGAAGGGARHHLEVPCRGLFVHAILEQGMLMGQSGTTLDHEEHLMQPATVCPLAGLIDFLRIPHALPG